MFVVMENAQRIRELGSDEDLFGQEIQQSGFRDFIQIGGKCKIEEDCKVVAEDEDEFVEETT